MIQSKS